MKLPDHLSSSECWNLLRQKLTPKRQSRMVEVARRRTNWLRLVVQDIHHPHNVSACLRSAEAFGIQNVHIVTLKERFSPSDVAQGAGGWLNIHRHESIADCVATLQGLGYKLAAGFPPAKADATLHELSVTEPIAILFGNERDGVASEWLEHINIKFTIPMFGMVESLNISVSAAITMHTLTHRAALDVGPAYWLSEVAQTELLARWAVRHFRLNDNQIATLKPSE